MMRERWREDPLRSIAASIDARLQTDGPDVWGGELPEALPGWIDLRGAPLTQIASAQEWRRVDASGLGPPDGHPGRFGFEDCTLVGCRFEGVALELRGACRFQDCDLRGATLHTSFLVGLELSGCDLRGAVCRYQTLRDAAITDCDLREADFSTVSFAGGRIVRCQLKGVVVDAGTGLYGTKLADNADDEVLAALSGD